VYLDDSPTFQADKLFRLQPQLKPFIINEGGGTEFILSEGLLELARCVEEYFPSIGISVKASEYEISVDNSDHKPTSSTTKQLRPYQLKCVDKIVKHAIDSGRAYLCLPTGAGKSVIMGCATNYLSKLLGL
jgi:type I site-specific restriction endonuclease